MGRVLLACFLLTFASAVTSSGQSSETGPAGLVKGLEALDGQLRGSLSASERASVHRAKALLVARHFDVPVRDTDYATVFTALDCVSTNIQRARNAARGKARSPAAKAKGCLAGLAEELADGGRAPAALRRDLSKLSKAVGAITTATRKGKAFGAKATALRRRSARFVARHFDGRPVAGVRFSDVFEALECVDVKVESGAVRGAGACARKLRRLLRGNLPPSQGGTSDAPSAPPITFGSDLSGDPVAIPGKYPEDTEFWTRGLTIPRDGTITTFRVRVGANPVDLPIRFSVVEPQPDGRVKVLTTTHPPYQLPGNSPGTYSFQTSNLSFACCKVKQGDIVTIDNRGADQTQDPYVWFARRPGFTTFSYTNPTPGAPTQDPGQFWTPRANEGYDLLVQAVVSPN
ncbi:MAG: hypothetical protein AVDCRST_MAG53-1008 [uncultured Solirubrobacteraceae bacterium]|uniref:Uncharacterized protein n=1 Tax=uncultured Solirubrobacteraceae bacterium TaxID=1162706 RepID=A0A6J4S5X8_9ACTN|nr:MAG: hypothetical protein AVDCRST_MAG53-1008 [uncultured Solirubrobacteraceae bacterium]